MLPRKDRLRHAQKVDRSTSILLSSGSSSDPAGIVGRLPRAESIAAKKRIILTGKAICVIIMSPGRTFDSASRRLPRKLRMEELRDEKVVEVRAQT